MGAQRSIRVFAIIFLFVFINNNAFAENKAAEILDRIKANYSRSISRIDKLQISTNIATVHATKTEMNGLMILDAESEPLTEDFFAEELGLFLFIYEQLFEDFEEIKESAVFSGIKQFSGAEMYHLEIEMDDSNFIRMLIDTKDLLLRSVELDINDSRKLNLKIEYSDYRRVNRRYKFPYQTVMSIIDFSLEPDEHEYVSEIVNQYEQLLQQCPESAAEFMHIGGFDFLYQIYKYGTIETVITVDNIIVN
ncbi:hypothetical protein CHISP_1533 [Chitinispirillum alkaliphilum]|nr:hypothetical protein CHISP_1533 [Chitinispirillum alkaliphilum]